MTAHSVEPGVLITGASSVDSDIRRTEVFSSVRLPSPARHCPEAGHVIRPSGKRGVTTSRTKAAHCSSETTPSAMPVPK
jgi:hypothetical protein